MKFSSILSPIFLAVSTSARSAQIYLSDISTSPQPAVYQPISPSTARLIFASRLGLAQYHSIGKADADTIRQLERFGGRPKKLLGGDEGSNRPKVMFVIEGVQGGHILAPYDQKV